MSLKGPGTLSGIYAKNIIKPRRLGDGLSQVKNGISMILKPAFRVPVFIPHLPSEIHKCQRSSSNHTKSRQNNLQKARQSRKTTVEVPDEDDSHQNSDTESNIYSQPNVHCSDRCSEHSPPPPDLDTGETWDLDFGNELPDLDCEDPAAGDLEPEMDDEVVEAPEISEENELKKFATLLSDAQEAARIQERELQKSSKRSKHYNRKSTTTLYRQ
ncbi:hypothetical protein B0H14DRAFT_3606592 [Mycena olivaceomarginata]|nr:hypothetical protein B0H14DRAFT_3606592 [Mycena olivaceomarginata]